MSVTKFTNLLTHFDDYTLIKFAVSNLGWHNYQFPFCGTATNAFCGNRSANCQPVDVDPRNQVITRHFRGYCELTGCDATLLFN